jgi:ankyrin repeat protein
MWPRGVLILMSLTVAAAAAASELANAARANDRAAVRRLLDAKANVNEPGGDGSTALHWAAYNDDAETAKLLIAAGADVHVLTRNGALTPLMIAATNGSAPVVQALLAAGANPNARATDGATPLMTAAASGAEG